MGWRTAGSIRASSSRSGDGGARTHRSGNPARFAVARAVRIIVHLHCGDLVVLTDLYPFLDPERIPTDLPGQLRRLAVDLDKLRSIKLRPFALRDAPLLENWAAVLAPVGVCLIGLASGHPMLGDRPIVTSPLYAADPEGRWVRSTSRFYLLGKSADATMRDRLASWFAGEREGDEDAGEGRA
jgi:hypothetical protein